MAGQAQFAAEVEQIVLHAGQRFAYGSWQVFTEQQADGAVQLIDIAHRSDSRLILGDAFAGSQSGAAVVAGAGDYF